MKYIPLGDRIIVRGITEAESAEATSSGIYIPDTAKMENEAIVIAIGPGVFDQKLEKYIPSELEVGDRIVHSNLGTLKESIRYDGQDCYVINESNILAYAQRS
jgi:co-chaperonin GroES (HSP10)